MNDFIEIKDLMISFNGKDVIKNINFSIKEGEIIGVMGGSGTGKSVLLNSLRGLKEYMPSKGSVIFHVAFCHKCNSINLPSKAGSRCPECGETYKLKDIDLWNDSDKNAMKIIRNKIAIMSQRTFNLYGNETVIENVMKPFIEAGYSKEDAVHQSINLLQSVNMLHRTLYRAFDLSGGEKQRVVLARQLAKNPLLLLADEPTGTLDPRTATEIENTLIKNVQEKHTTIVLTSHWTETIERLADKVILLENGKISSYGSPAQVIGEFIKQIPEEEAIKEEKPVTDMAVVECKGIKKVFYSIDSGIIRALDNVDLTVYDNEIFGLIGMSGAGKTTLSKAISGNMPAHSSYEGECNVRIGEDWVSMKIGGLQRGAAKDHIAVIYQEYDLFADETVLENLVGAVPELPDELARMHAIDALNSTGFDEGYIGEILDKMPNEISEGEKQRVVIALALIREPKILILDEPTGTLDSLSRQRVAETLKRIRTEWGATIVVVTHDYDFALAVCDRCAFMRGGKIVSIGEPSKVISELYSAGGLESG